MKKLAWLIMLSLLASGLAACAGSPSGGAESETADSGAVTTAAEETKPVYLDTLPSFDYDGKDITILCRDDKVYEIWTDAEDGEIINDAVFARNRAVEEKYDVKIGYVTSAGAWESSAIYKGVITSAVLGGDDAYDIISGYMAYTMGMGAEGYFVNLYSLDNIDLTNVWWVKGFIDNNTIKDNIFFALGDISLTMWENIYAVFFNKQLISNYGLENPYDIVNAGKWTLDKLMAMSETVSNDVNGDGVYDSADLYGFATNVHSMRAMATSFDIKIVKRNDEGSFDLIYYSDKTVEAFNKLYDFIHKSDATYMLDPNIDHAGQAQLAPMFTEGRVLFMTFTLTLTEALRDMQDDFGIIPFPKYDEAQQSYLSHSYDGLSIFGIPITAANHEMSAMILEAMCAESSQTVIPNFYDIKLKVKVTRDNDSGEMLDIIRQGLYFDFAYCHTVETSYIFSIYGDMIGSNQADFVSNYKTNEKKYQSSLAKLLERYDEVILSGLNNG